MTRAPRLLSAALLATALVATMAPANASSVAGAAAFRGAPATTGQPLVAESGRGTAGPAVEPGRPGAVTISPATVGMAGAPPERIAAGARAGSFRINASEWGRVEWRPGQFAWEGVDEAIAGAIASGARDVLLIVGLGAEWAVRDGPGTPNSRPPKSMALWDTWVRTLATRYAGRGFAYHVWNEANLSTFWTGTPEEMAELTDRAYRTIKRVDPSATVVAASTTLRLGGAFQSFYPRYLAALKARGWPFDVYSLHSYPASTGTPEDRARLILGFRRVLQQAGAPQRPIWDTEVNYGMAGPGPAYPDQDISGRQAATWVARTYLDAINLGIERTYWYQQQEPDDFLGVQMWPETPGLAAERWAHRWLSGRQTPGCGTAGVLTRCQLHGPEGLSWIQWTTPGARVRVRVPAGAVSRCSALGRCTRVTPGSVTRIGSLPVRLGPR